MDGDMDHVMDGDMDGEADGLMDDDADMKLCRRMCVWWYGSQSLNVKISISVGDM